MRYRSYYYDSETGFYYLQSRYYDPIVKRFISPDSTDYLTENGDFDGYNLYAYCVNNPVNCSDPNGQWVCSISVSFGGAMILGFSAFATILIDGKKDFGIFIGFSALHGFAIKGLTWSFGLYWKYSSISKYLKSVTGSIWVGKTVGIATIFEYPNYPKTTKRLVGIQISSGTTGVYYESAPFDGGIYIPLKKYISNVFKKCGSNIFKINKALKSFKVKISVKG